MSKELISNMYNMRAIAAEYREGKAAAEQVEPVTFELQEEDGTSGLSLSDAEAAAALEEAQEEYGQNIPAVQGGVSVDLVIPAKAEDEDPQEVEATVVSSDQGENVDSSGSYVTPREQSFLNFLAKEAGIDIEEQPQTETEKFEADLNASRYELEQTKAFYEYMTSKFTYSSETKATFQENIEAKGKEIVLLEQKLEEMKVAEAKAEEARAAEARGVQEETPEEQEAPVEKDVAKLASTIIGYVNSGVQLSEEQVIDLTKSIATLENTQDVVSLVNQMMQNNTDAAKLAEFLNNTIIQDVDGEETSLMDCLISITLNDAYLNQNTTFIASIMDVENDATRNEFLSSFAKLLQNGMNEPESRQAISAIVLQELVTSLKQDDEGNFILGDKAQEFVGNILNYINDTNNTDFKDAIEKVCSENQIDFNKLVNLMDSYVNPKQGPDIEELARSLNNALGQALQSGNDVAWGEFFNSQIANLTPEEIVALTEEYNKQFNSSLMNAFDTILKIQGTKESTINFFADKMLEAAGSSSQQTSEKAIEIICRELYNSTVNKLGTVDEFVNAIINADRHNGEDKEAYDRILGRINETYSRLIQDGELPKSKGSLISDIKADFSIFTGKNKLVKILEEAIKYCNDLFDNGIADVRFED